MRAEAIPLASEAMTNLDRYRKDLDRLVASGKRLYASMVLSKYPAQYATFGLKNKADIKKLPSVLADYQGWYSEALRCIGQLMPERVDDFRAYYQPIKPRKDINYGTYTIEDYLRSLTLTRFSETIVDISAAIPVLGQQLMMVQALERRFESSLFDIRALLQADLFDDELDAADEINKKGFQRGAGAISGVVLEGLATVCANHKIAVPKNPTISKLNEALKSADVIDQPTWRFIQHLGDLRNLCDHKKAADPTTEQMEELIAGTRKIMKTIL